MTRRTGEQASRRRTIADASSGFPERNRVVLYTNIGDGSDPVPILQRLRDHAEARDWVVPEDFVLFDTSPEHTSRRERPGWFEASRLLRECRADGLVAPAEAQIAKSPGERAELRAWLSSIQKFANYLHQASAGEKPAGVEAEGAGE
ncbi:hypothetical protein [Streptomyces sp. NPDC091212]|uniref:hypothetical protein n=1 Tax=Streptomyces sp. NPDC091212 TaxID=3155191 RepID=UPI0034152861